MGLMLTISIASLGCTAPDESQFIQFSPDGNTAVEVFLDVVTALPLPDSAEVFQYANVRWWNADKPDMYRRTCVDHSVPKSIEIHSLRKNVHIVFSPDSRHLAIVSPRYLTCLDLRTGKKWQLNDRGEHVDSAAWMTNNEVVYASYPLRKAQANQRGVEVKFWRQLIDSPPETRKWVYTDFREAGEDGERRTWSSVYFQWDGKYEWSPGGRFAVFRPTSRTSLAVLDVGTGTVRRFGEWCGYEVATSWRLDDGMVACLGRELGGKGSRALLYNTKTGDIKDLNEDFQQVVGDRWKGRASVYALLLESESLPLQARGISRCWTPDGRFIVLNHWGALVRPSPWRYIQVNEEIMKKGLVPGKRLLPWVRQLAVPGWLLFKAKDSSYYAVDYDLQMVIPLDEPEYRARVSFNESDVMSLVSPNGKYTAHWWGAGKDGLIVKSLQHPLVPQLSGQ